VMQNYSTARGQRLIAFLGVVCFLQAGINCKVYEVFLVSLLQFTSE